MCSIKYYLFLNSSLRLSKEDYKLELSKWGQTLVDSLSFMMSLFSEYVDKH